MRSSAPAPGWPCASWGALGLYRWEGQRLTENFVEQDYFSRRPQLGGDGPDPVELPAVAPWDTPAGPADPAAGAVVRSRLDDGDFAGVTLDDGRDSRRLIGPGHTEVSDLFSAGDQVAFRVAQHG